ncbi:YaaA family protein [Haloactinopolyspora alba]|uniref:YaaA family protein n=1 Tax=Haloactinopolyspora alba TaxID=648780 RepID=UPI000D0DB835|nr:peroxide stress protein YaaA [Haloactinopolyspora alba]
MLILLPPSEGKTAPTSGAPVDLDALSFPQLTGDRVDMMAALVRLCREQPDAAVRTLGLGPQQADDVARNGALPHAPAAPARLIYSGVLHDALGLAELGGAAAARADSALVLMSALWGALRPSDTIPAYRLGGDVTLPGVGKVSTFWRSVLRTALPPTDDGLIVDLRSSTYAGFWRPDVDAASRTAAVRVLHEHDGKRTVVSHHNKATKGHIARRLLELDNDPATPRELAELLSADGWSVESTPGPRPTTPTTVDVIVRHVPAR